MTTSELLIAAPGTGTDAPRYTLLLTRDPAEVAAAQRLRHQVFAGEMGARLHSPVPGLDVDSFDEFCDHLVVRAEPAGEIVGTYRMLPPDRAAEAGRLYAESEFDLTAVRPLRDTLVETGRSCVHPDHRTGAVVSLIWAGIGRYLLLSGHRWLAGCASIPLTDGGSLAAGVWNAVRDKHFAPPRFRVTPRVPFPVGTVAAPARTVLPPLLKGYLRLGAWVCGPPAHDPDFGVADLFVLLGMDHVDRRYLRFFLGDLG
ncbi:MAG TPA: GNAT family N-acyltransferase [Actinophytocola sp.]|uniref:GNAT family N-acetyltransferase n=1 Tax=Actinophytocola sp. TaxID=1872138 RepID=UPI002DB5A463|nr:GNAT family N-acyltransferase [Actinophytocola sp.]HEU5470124.1 GNAT family N-acyltransferase [Actinophytocola sp.]